MNHGDVPNLHKLVVKIGRNNMTKVFYKGWSSEAAHQSPSRRFLIKDKEVVKQDLLNHIWTELGERQMHPQFGTRIPLLVFEPLDEISLQIIKEDITKVVDFDPRVELIDLSILALPDNNAVACFVDLKYLELNETETWKLEITSL